MAGEGEQLVEHLLKAAMLHTRDSIVTIFMALHMVKLRDYSPWYDVNDLDPYYPTHLNEFIAFIQTRNTRLL